MGDPNASIPTPQPVMMRPMFGSMGKARGRSSIAFVSGVSLPAVAAYQISKRIEPVRNCRNLTKRDMRLNDALPKMHVDPETYLVTADGIPLTCTPAAQLPLSQRYSLF